MPAANVATSPDSDAARGGLVVLNSLDTARARQAFAGCCASDRWATEMERGRPYPSAEAVIERADRIFDGLRPDDWLQAFGAHARIGAPAPGDERGGSEQAGATSASQQQREALREGNERYEAKFGHVFLIRAKGLDATRMLSALRERLDNSPERELSIAASQQREIAHLRLEDLLGS
jgi:OHCU decarboxylase